MNVVKKIFIILIILVLIVGGLSYLDYFLVKTKDSLPRIALKKVVEEKEVEIYSALFYKVWYCTADKTIIVGDYKDPDPVCPNAYVFKDGYYTNASGLKIPKKSLLLMIHLNIYTHEMIDIMNTETEVNNAVYVAETFGKSFYSKIEDKTGTINGEETTYPIVVFKSFEEDKDKDTYEWKAIDEENNYYCARVNDKEEFEFSKYTEGYCEEKFEPIRLDKKWCDLYQNSTLVYNESEMIGNYCKE